MSEQMRYITDEAGQRVGVMLDWRTYLQLTNQPVDRDLLVNLSQEELQALAESALSPQEQRRLDDLLERNAEGQLSPEETTELDDLLTQIDQLNILKTRARYTLQYYDNLASAK
ncbi:MAG TPA: hypothetical protein ENK32_05125 [Anaerolineae bacterium]|nr:hypothetical protein [Anaerolineae bacterium]